VPGATPAVSTGDTTRTFGVTARGQAGSAELNAGWYTQRHDRGTSTLAKVDADVEWGELSYVVFPWMVPAVRVERIGLKPSDGSNVNDVHLMPGVAFLVRPNVKAVLVGNIELAKGFPNDASGTLFPWDGGNADWGNFVAAPKDTSTTTSKLNEFQSIALFFAWAI